MSGTQIPKKIHYCWFGMGEKNQLIKKCISSWKKNLADYAIIEWNEDNFDVSCNEYVRQAYESKKWAFVTDYVRLYVLYQYGGIYMDTDIEVLKPLDVFLKDEAFVGLEARDSIQTGIMAAVPHQRTIGELLQIYQNMQFINIDGSYNMTTNVVTITRYFKEHGFVSQNIEQTIEGVRIYKTIYFCPNTLGMIFERIPKKTYTIHHFDSSWQDNRRKKNSQYRVRHYIVGVLRNIFGTDRIKKVKGK